MKTLMPGLAGVLLAPAASAALLAHVVTDKGTIHVELQYDTAPQAVANFMTLAQGTRPRIDPLTGAITDQPLYIGEKFFRTANTPSFKFAQTGSGSGDNSGSSGFTFRDEFDPAVRHTGYTLSSANAGPNTNNGQIFFTGNVAIPQYDDVHTIIGLIPDAASRLVVSQVIAAGDNGSMITGISFERTDASAEAFDEMAQGLPSLSVPSGGLEVDPGLFSRYHLDPPATTGDVVHASRSTDFATWTKVVKHHVGIETVAVPPALSSVDLDDAPTPSAFYHIALARDPSAVAPSHLRDRTVHAEYSGTPDFTFDFSFDSSGNGGTITYTPATGSPVAGGFTVIDAVIHSSHGVQFIAYTPFNPPYFFVKTGCDSATDTLISGHHNTQYWTGAQWADFDKGACTITR